MLLYKKFGFNEYPGLTNNRVGPERPESSRAEVCSSSSECYFRRAFSLDKDASGRDIIWALGQKSGIKGIDYFKVDRDSEWFNRVVPRDIMDSSWAAPASLKFPSSC